MADIDLTPTGLVLKRGLLKAADLLAAEDHLAVQAASVFVLSFVIGLVIF
jgi:hypothetical protein